MKKLLLTSLCLSLVACSLSFVFSPASVFQDSLGYGLMGLFGITIAGLTPEKFFRSFLVICGVLMLILGQIAWPIKVFLA